MEKIRKIVALSFLLLSVKGIAAMSEATKQTLRPRYDTPRLMLDEDFDEHIRHRTRNRYKYSVYHRYNPWHRSWHKPWQYAHSGHKQRTATSAAAPIKLVQAVQELSRELDYQQQPEQLVSYDQIKPPYDGSRDTYLPLLIMALFFLASGAGIAVVIFKKRSL